MQHHVVAAGFGPGDDGLEAVFLDAEHGIEGIDRFGGIADDDKNFVAHGGVSLGGISSRVLWPISA